jgi:anti-sigma factor RsiW
MTCQSALPLIEPYIDGELDAAQQADIQLHLNECPSCAVVHRRLSDLSSDLRTLAPRYDASEALRARVQSSLRQAAPKSKIIAWPIRQWAIAATVLLALSVGFNFFQLRSRSQSPVAQEIVSSHIRSLIGEHLLDVPSTDQHNVKPWFNGKLDFAPDVKDFATAGFPLIGGRIDYIDHRPVAALVYKRRQHIINLFVWPSTEAPSAPEAVSGFNLITWNKAGMNFCAVSDVNAAELQQFADLYRQ